jgi:succinyl-CoA synthetase beta subunit
VLFSWEKAVDLDFQKEKELTVATAAVELAKVRDGEVGNGNGAATVVLDHLVLGAKGAAALDVGGVAAVLDLDGKGILADG